MKKNKKNIFLIIFWILIFLAFLALLIVSSIYFSKFTFNKNDIGYWYKFACLVFLLISSIVIFILLLLLMKFFYEIINQINKTKIIKEDKNDKN